MQKTNEISFRYSSFQNSLPFRLLSKYLTYLLTYLLTYSLTPWSRVLLEKLTGSINSPHFIEPEGSLPYSQVPATFPYPEPTASSLHPLPLPEDPS